jgi:hypothetical protein
MKFTLTHRRNISAVKTGNKWVTNIYTDRECQIPQVKAEQLLATGDWRWGRNELHRTRVAAGVR